MKVSLLLALAVLASCAPEPLPLLALPHSWSVGFSPVDLPLPGEPVRQPQRETTVDLWVYGVDSEELPVVTAFETGVRRVEWRPSDPRTTPVGARELRVVLSRKEGSFTVGQESEIDLSPQVRLSNAPRGRAAPFLAGSRTVLVVRRFLERVTIVTAAGAPLLADRYECLPAPEEALESEMMRCLVRAPPPLSGEPDGVRSVRARFDDSGDISLSNEVQLP